MEADLTELILRATTPRMGRPPLKRNVETVVTTVRLTATVAAEIDAIAGPNKRSGFIREAVEREIKRRSKAKP